MSYTDPQSIISETSGSGTASAARVLTTTSPSAPPSITKKRSASPEQTKKFDEEHSNKKQHTQSHAEAEVEEEGTMPMSIMSEEKEQQPKEENGSTTTINIADSSSTNITGTTTNTTGSTTEYCDSIRAHLIDRDTIAMPNVLADLILEYSNHPLLDLWYEIELLCQQFDARHYPNDAHCDQIGVTNCEARMRSCRPLIPTYYSNHDTTDTKITTDQSDSTTATFEAATSSTSTSSSSASLSMNAQQQQQQQPRSNGPVAPTRIDQLEAEYRIKLNQFDFQLPLELKLLWSVHNGLDIDQQRFFQDRLWPSIEVMESIVRAASTPLLQVSYILLGSSTGECYKYYNDVYDLRHGVFYWHAFEAEGTIEPYLEPEDDEEEEHEVEYDEDCNPIVSPERTRTFTPAMQGCMTPFISFESYHHLFLCLHTELKEFLASPFHAQHISRINPTLRFGHLRERSSLLYPILRRYPYEYRFPYDVKHNQHTNDVEYTLLEKGGRAFGNAGNKSISMIAPLPQYALTSTQLTQVRSHLQSVLRDFILDAISTFEQYMDITRTMNQLFKRHVWKGRR